MLRRFAFPLLLLVVLLVYLGTAGGRAILDDGDALYAHIAQEMVRSDECYPIREWGAVSRQAHDVLAYGLRVQDFGFTEFAARLPSALAVIESESSS